MAFRMSEQPRTIKIYNLLAGTNEFIGEGDAYIPPHTGLPANSTDIAPPDIPAGFVAVFNSDESSWHLVEDHLFLNSVRYRKMLPGYRRKGSFRSGTAQPG